MNGHTPGPWTWDRHWLNAGDKPPRKMVLWYTTADDGVHCSEADARLIAEAPALYEIVRRVVNQGLLERHAEREAARALLARIRGTA